MRTTIEKTFQVDEPIDKTWAFLSDPNRVVTCVPGAKIVEQVDEQTYKGAVSMKVGPVVTDFKGDITIERRDEAEHVLELSGTGKDTKGKGTATMKMTGRLRALDGGGTEVMSSMEINVVGRLAQFGSRLFADISNRMFDQFTDCFTESLQVTGAPAEAAEADEGTPPPAEETAGEAASAPPAQAAPRQTDAQARAAEPVKALPLFFQALWSAIARFFRRLMGRKAES